MSVIVLADNYIYLNSTSFLEPKFKVASKTISSKINLSPNDIFFEGSKTILLLIFKFLLIIKFLILFLLILLHFLDGCFYLDL